MSKKCRWFAYCENDATTTRTHPILGDVPVCGGCNNIDRVNRDKV